MGAPKGLSVILHVTWYSMVPDLRALMIREDGIESCQIGLSLPLTIIPKPVIPNISYEGHGDKRANIGLFQGALETIKSGALLDAVSSVGPARKASFPTGPPSPEAAAVLIVDVVRV